MEGEIQKFLLEFLEGLHISNCDIFYGRPQVMGQQEKMKPNYIAISLPNGINYMGAFAQANGLITIGAKDKKGVMGLINAPEITRIANAIKDAFPHITPDFSLLDFEFSSDDSDGMGWHEYYYTFQIYINKSN